MSETLLIALFSFAASVLGSFGGILVSARLTGFRLEQLEKRVNEHNQVVKRTYVLEEKMKVANHRIEDLERKENHV